jgi:arylsulfatase A-like enzyme/cytochrome c-type biogenesis protein CcmH/NrfG
LNQVRTRIHALCLVALILAGCKSRTPTAPDAAARLKPLNVVVITIDTLRADHIRSYGYQKIETPTLDRLAREGTLFENAVAQTPLTPPSHASIFTGTYPTVHKVRNTGGFVLQPSSKTLATILQEHGWDTAAFVGASVLKKSFGFNQGFAVYDDKMPRREKKDEGEYPERPAAEVVDHALAWLGERSSKPFFAWLHVYDPHRPFKPPEPFRKQYLHSPYDGEIAYTDRELGRFIDAVEKKSPPDRTLIVVLADHGESLGEHGEYTHGIFLYDATLRIPLIVKGPGVPAGMRFKPQVRTIDVLPTVLAILGGRPPEECQGSSVLPALSGKQISPTRSYGETLYPKMNMGWAELRAIRTDRWKYIRAPKPELYDLAQDPHETRNVIDQNPGDVRDLEQFLKRITQTSDGKPEKVDTSTVDQRTMDQLKSLGYLSGFTGRQYELTGKGPDPKDRIEVLRVHDAIETPDAKLPPARRIEMLRSVLAGDAANPTTYYLLGGELEKVGRYADAMKLYETAIRNGVENGKLYSRIADLYLRSGRKDQAIPYYEKAAQYNPSDVESQSNLATAYLEKGRVADAEKIYKWILTVEEYPAAYNGLGLIAIQRQDPAAARVQFEKAVQLDPDLVEAQLNLGLIYKMAGDRARARTCFEAFLAKASPAQYGEVIPKVRQELAAMP